MVPECFCVKSAPSHYVEVAVEVDFGERDRAQE
jgi:hypothetical protein